MNNKWKFCVGFFIVRMAKTKTQNGTTRIY